MSVGANDPGGNQLPMRWAVIFVGAVVAAVAVGVATGVASGIPAGVEVGIAAGAAAAFGTFLTTVGLLHQILPHD